MNEIEDANHIKLDIFPAEVYDLENSDESLGDQYRVIVTDNHFYAFSETDEGIRPVIKVPLGSFTGTNRDGYTINSGWYIKRAQNCGCGSRLRGYHPFPGVPHISQLG